VVVKKDGLVFDKMKSLPFYEQVVPVLTFIYDMVLCHSANILYIGLPVDSSSLISFLEQNIILHTFAVFALEESFERVFYS
jgi:hypothetical protein